MPTTTEQSTIRGILAGFISDPPDTEYQRGYLAAVLSLGKDVLSISSSDPVWDEANQLLGRRENAA